MFDPSPLIRIQAIVTQINDEIPFDTIEIYLQAKLHYSTGMHQNGFFLCHSVWLVTCLNNRSVWYKAPGENYTVE